MSDALEAAHRLLGTLVGARAALLQGAAAYLPPARVIRLHAAAAAADGAQIVAAEDLVHRRVEALRRSMGQGLASAAVVPLAVRAAVTATATMEPTAPILPVARPNGPSGPLSPRAVAAAAREADSGATAAPSPAIGAASPASFASPAPVVTPPSVALASSAPPPVARRPLPPRLTPPRSVAPRLAEAEPTSDEAPNAPQRAPILPDAPVGLSAFFGGVAPASNAAAPAPAPRSDAPIVPAGDLSPTTLDAGGAFEAPPPESSAVEAPSDASDSRNAPVPRRVAALATARDSGLLSGAGGPPPATPPDGAPRAVAPQIARPSGDDALEAGVGDDDAAAPALGLGLGGAGAFSVTADRRVAVAVRNAPRAPRLTDIDEEPVPAPVPPQSSSSAFLVDELQVQAAVAEAMEVAMRGDFSRAIQCFTDALEMRPGLADAHIGRGRCHLELGDYSSAMSDFQRAEDAASDTPEPHVAMGDLYFARREYKRAIDFYDHAVELDGAHAMARCRRGISHYYQKNYRQAHQDLQRANALDPNIPNIRKYVQMAARKLERGD